MFNEYDDILTVDDLCSILLIGKNTAYDLLNKGKINAFRIGKTWRIPRLSIQEYILNESGFGKR